MLRTSLLLALAALARQAVPISGVGGTDQLYNSVVAGDYESAVAQTKELEKENKGDLISVAVEILIDLSERNVIDYAYHLYNNDSKELIHQYFPVEFRSIFGDHTVKLISKRDAMPIKLGNSVDRDGDRTAYGDGSNVISERMAWKLLPTVSDLRVYFKIYNPLHNMYLKLGIPTDRDDEHTAYGAVDSSTNRHQWYLQPAKSNDQLLFYIVNREYLQALKLGRAVDSDGDRQVYSQYGSVFGQPDLFGWNIAPF